MSKETAEKFIAAWEAKDPQIVEAVKSVSSDSLDFETLAGIAASLGYELKAVELAEQFELYRERTLVQAESRELSIEELDQVAGGYRDLCAEDYDPDDWCWFADRCSSAMNYYKTKEDCKSTYDSDRDFCLMTDYCSQSTTSYD